MANGVSRDLSALFSTDQRDFLVRNNGDQVKISSLNKKIVGVYFESCYFKYITYLVEIYNEVASKGEFEVVLCSLDRDEELFEKAFSKMPWLAIPFSDYDARIRLNGLLNRGSGNLVIIYLDGKVSTWDLTMVMELYGVDVYPFTQERINFLEEQEEEARWNQSLSSVLLSKTCGYLLSNNGNQVPVSELEGKTVGIYFSCECCERCNEFTATLVEVYNKLKEKGENFEIVFISVVSRDEEKFKQEFAKMPWLALPFDKRSYEKLGHYFDVGSLPVLVIICPDGKTLNLNVAKLVEEHGIDFYPFTPEKVAALPEIEKAKQESQTLESLLVSGDDNFVIGKNGSKVPVSELVGKNILLYFSTQDCWRCCEFTTLLVKTYHEIKAKDDAFEVIFISSDDDQSSFDEYFSRMPWLALPYGDSRNKFLKRKFKLNNDPSKAFAIAIGPSGRTMTKEAYELINLYGANIYPFTEEQLKHLEEQDEERAKGWPEKLKHDLHDQLHAELYAQRLDLEHLLYDVVDHQLYAEHDQLVLTRGRIYYCYMCKSSKVTNWFFYCDQCGFYLHPECALEKKDDPNGKEGFV